MIGEMSSIPSGGGKPVGKEGGQYSHVRDVKFVKFYPLTSVWERNNFLKQKDEELFPRLGTDLCPTEIPMEFWRGPRKKKT